MGGSRSGFAPLLVARPVVPVWLGLAPGSSSVCFVSLGSGWYIVRLVPGEEDSKLAVVVLQVPMVEVEVEVGRG